MHSLTLLDVIGNTPLVEITHLHSSKDVRIYAKLEGANPGGSIKDRAALYMFQKANTEGLLGKSRIIIEPTSGNTGIALAMLGAVFREQVRLLMPECVSTERMRIIEAYGAKVELTPADEGTDGAIRRAHELLESDPGKYLMLNQFANEANVLAHYETTGPEIFKQTNGEIDILVAGMGTTGTLMGTGRYLKKRKETVRIIGVEPPVGHRIQGLKNMQEAIIPEIYNPAILDGKVTVNDDESFEVTRTLAKEEGLFVGMSSGAAMTGALKVAQSIEKGIIVTIFPDRGDRYLSTELFRSICAKCNP